MAKKTSARATADATENPKSGPGDTSRPKVSPEVQLVWARVISRAASDSDFAAVLRDNLAEAFAVFGVSGLGDIDPEQDLIPSYSAALEMIGAAAHPPAAASGLMPGQAEPNPVGDDITHSFKRMRLRGNGPRLGCQRLYVWLLVDARA